MPLSTDARKAMLVFGGGFLLFWVLKDGRLFGKSKGEKKVAEGDRKKVDPPTVNPKDMKGNKKAQNGFIALKAYIDAYNNREPEKALEELNRELAKDLGVRVFKRSSDGCFVVADLAGGTILVNNT